MRLLFKKKAPVPVEQISTAVEVTEFPLPPMPREPAGAGDINLVLLVKELAPVRIKQNEKEIETMKSKIATLEKENLQLSKLLQAVEE
jgi:hypothetical protein